MHDRSAKNGDGLLVLDHCCLPRRISELALSSIEWQPTGATFASSILIRDGFNWLKSIPENKLNPTVFHGSSRLFLDSIITHGLNPAKNPLQREDFTFVRELMLRVNPTMVDADLSHIPRHDSFRGEESVGAVYRQNSISVSLGLSSAMGYARKGPEKIGWFLMSVSDLRHSDSPLISQDDRIKLLEIHERYAKLLEAHEPQVVALRPRGILYPISSGNPFSLVMHDASGYAKLVRYATGELDVPPGSEELGTDAQGLVTINLEAIVANIHKRSPDQSPEDVMQSALRGNSEFEICMIESQDIVGIYAP